MKKILFFFLMISNFKFLPAQTTPASLSWNNKRCAVVLTNDDTLNVHLSNALPVLDSTGLKATFYISDYFGGLYNQIPTWKKAAANGHELGNHTMFHPCAWGIGRECVNPDYDLNKYSFKRITDEIRAMNNLLTAIDGKTKRTFAFPCNDTKIRDTSYFTPLIPDFNGARAVRDEFPKIENTDVYNLPSILVNGQSGTQLIALVKDALAKGTLVIFLFHGVGGEHEWLL